MQQMQVRVALIGKLKTTFMKLTFILPAFLLFSISASAQIQKGTTQLGVDLSFYGDKSPVINGTTYSSSDNFNFSPSFGKAIKENLFVGINAFCSIRNATASNDIYYHYDERTKVYGAAIWLRKYYNLSKSFYVFVGGEAGSRKGSSDYLPSTSFGLNKSKSFAVYANMYPGLSYKLGKYFYLDASWSNLVSINYAKQKQTISDSQGTSNTYISKNYGFSTSIGSTTNPMQFGLRWML